MLAHCVQLLISNVVFAAAQSVDRFANAASCFWHASYKRTCDACTE